MVLKTRVLPVPRGLRTRRGTPVVPGTVDSQKSRRLDPGSRRIECLGLPYAEGTSDSQIIFPKWLWSQTGSHIIALECPDSYNDVGTPPPQSWDR